MQRNCLAKKFLLVLLTPSTFGLDARPLRAFVSAPACAVSPHLLRGGGRGRASKYRFTV